MSRRRYDRLLRAREEAEALLEAKSRELWEANQRLKAQAEALEKTVESRTAELETAMHAAEASNRAKSVFLANMSHEIRTPLNGVLGMAKAIGDTDLSPDQQEMTDTILDSGQILLGVLNDILDISKIEAGQMDIENIPFDIAELAQSAKRHHGFKAREKGLGFEVTVREAARKWVTGDPTRLRQVTGNLIANAIKFTKTGGIQVTFDLDAAPPNATLRIEVRDTGIGISADGIANLFRPFHQLDASVAREYGGTGLGLSISHHICTLMKGDITVQSTPGSGTSFIATAQVATAPAPEAVAAPDIQSLRETLTGKHWRLLVAEDNKTNQMVLSKLLQPYELEITLVDNGEGALQATRKDHFDLILMDINMPVMDGIDATRAIRADEASGKRPATPIIALTANSMTHQIESYLTCGMNGHLAKPLVHDTLLQTIAQAVTKPELLQVPS
ncbi:response regulator [Alphaproteobacteria bacterium KMM 3653]|uniref:histidine kinase n=1 Tax=Harenicola maris TaxID=2841044 RepID=A0AAP2CSM0_9RHOB|nr:response regulator [Harenicola maris]